MLLKHHEKSNKASTQRQMQEVENSRGDAKDEFENLSEIVVENMVKKSDNPGYDAMVKNGDILNLSALLVE